MVFMENILSCLDGSRQVGLIERGAGPCPFARSPSRRSAEGEVAPAKDEVHPRWEGR